MKYNIIKKKKQNIYVIMTYFQIKIQFLNIYAKYVIIFVHSLYKMGRKIENALRQFGNQFGYSVLYTV